jgi:hypothetical protein
MTKMLLKPKELIVHHHLGLGDHLICNGLVNYLLDALELERLYLISVKTNAPSVRFLYSDEPRITILDFDWPKISQQEFAYWASNQLGVPMLTIAAQSAENFDVHFYRSLGVPFDVRWSHFRLPAVMTSAHDFYRQHIRHERYCLVAAKSSVSEHNLQIDTALPIYFVEPLTDSMLDWVEVIKHASEIHCIDSGFIHLVNSFDLTGAKLYYHDVGRGAAFVTRHEWVHVRQRGAD